MNFSECWSTNDEVLNHKIKNCVYLILQKHTQFKKNDSECMLCNSKLILRNIHDLMRIYALLLKCLDSHCVEVDLLKINVEKIFLLEIFILEFIMPKEINDIQLILLYSNNVNEKLYVEALKSQLLAVYMTHYKESMFKINCEQDIESFLYKIYKKSKGNLGDKMFNNLIMDKSENGKDIITYLLILLYKRKEYNRFLKVFHQANINTFLLRLHLVFSIMEEDKKRIKEYYKRYSMLFKTLRENINRQYSEFIDTSHLKTTKEHDLIQDATKNITQALEKPLIEERSIGEFETEKLGISASILQKPHSYEEYNQSNLKIIPESEIYYIKCDYKSVNDNLTSAKDKLVFKEYILIYNFINDNIEKYNLNLSDIKMLFHEVKDIQKWLYFQKSVNFWNECVQLWASNRNTTSFYVDNSMIDICINYKRYECAWNIFINSNFNNTSSYLRGITICCTALQTDNHCKWKRRVLEVIDNIFINLKSVNLEVILESILSMIMNLSYKLIIRVLNEIQAYIIHIKLEDAYIQLIFYFYNLYCTKYNNEELHKIICQNAIYIYSKWMRSKKYNFFATKSKFNTKIISSMLGICDITKNCEFFNKVCKDILVHNIRLNREICSRLENYHSKYCTICDQANKQLVSKKEGVGFIKHLFK